MTDPVVVIVSIALLVAAVAGRRHLWSAWGPVGRSARRYIRSASDQPVLLTVLGLALCATTAWVVVNVLFNPYRRVRWYGTTTLFFWVLVTAAMLPVVLRVLASVGRRVDHGTRAERIGIPAAALLAGLVVQLVIGYTTLRPAGFDAGLIINSAAALADGVDPMSSAYFSEYPNNILLLLGLWKYFAALQGVGVADADFMLAAVVLNALVLSAGLLLTYVAARRLANGTVAVVSLVLASTFVVISPWIGTPYSDTLALVFPVLILYAFLRVQDAGRRSRWAWWILIGVATVVGYSIKPTVIFATLAVIIFVLSTSPARRTRGRSLIEPAMVIGTLAIIFVGGNMVITYAEQASDVVTFDIPDNDQAFPVTHFLKMGAQGNGWYSGEDVSSTRATPPSERFGDGIKVYLDRVEAMGPGGYANFLARKQFRSMSDGSFFQWQEGGMVSQPFVHDGRFASVVQSYYGPDGDRHGTLMLYWQVSWMVVLGLVAAPLVVRGRFVFGDAATIMRLSIVGLLVFLLLFETRSRYLYLYVPYFSILAAISLQALASKREAAATSPRGRRIRRADDGTRPSLAG